MHGVVFMNRFTLDGASVLDKMDFFFFFWVIECWPALGVSQRVSLCCRWVIIHRCAQKKKLLGCISFSLFSCNLNRFLWLLFLSWFDYLPVHVNQVALALAWAEAQSTSYDCFHKHFWKNGSVSGSRAQSMECGRFPPVTCDVSSSLNSLLSTVFDLVFFNGSN